MMSSMQENSQPFVSSIIKLAETEGISEQDRKLLLEQINQAIPHITADPGNQTDANAQLLSCMALMLFARVENLYGAGSHEKLNFQPSFQGFQHSKVGPIFGDHSTFGVTIGSHATTWEAVFYEVAHEMVHFLNPVASAHEKQLAALEEGVAVKFAEAVYRELISAYTGRPPKISPVTMPDNRYYPAFKAANKIPDGVLAAVRDRFGSFAGVNDAAAFGSLTSEHLEQHEIKLLMTPFFYPVPSILIK